MNNIFSSGQCGNFIYEVIQDQATSMVQGGKGSTAVSVDKGSLPAVKS